MKKIYVFQPELGPAHRYEIGDDEIVHHPPHGAPRSVRWEDIRYLEDVTGRKVDIVADAKPPLPLFYGTRAFADLMDNVCARLAVLHRDQLGAGQTFRSTRAFFAHRIAVLGVFAVLILGSLVYLQDRTFVWMFVLGTTGSMAFYVLRQPHTATLGEDGLILTDFLGRRRVAYRRIAGVGFALHGDRHTAYLCLRVQLTNGRCITIQRFENLVLLYLFIRTRLAKDRLSP